MISSYLIYGANGYTGELVARAAKARGQVPILAARRESAVRPLAEALGLRYRHFTLDDPRAVDAGLAGVTAVLHCAGPFSQTSRAMADACLRTHTHYLDVTGEIPVLEALAARDAEAKGAGVMLLPAVGFDVVPSDCLAAHLKRRLPTASWLRLGFQMHMAMSRGTTATTFEGFGLPNTVRRDTVLTRMPMGALTRDIDFGRGVATAVSIPWGDVSTAYHSTGIANIEVYVAVPLALRFGMKLSGVLAPLLQSSAVQSFLKRRAVRGGAGPSSEERAGRRVLLWGEAQDDAGQRVVTRMQTPDAYTLTVETALASLERVMRGEAVAGFQTPSKAFGPNFVLEIAGVTRSDE